MIGERILKIRVEQEQKDLAIRVDCPQGSGRIWTCSYEIDWPEGTKRMDAAGADAIQALQCALEMIGTELYTSSYHRKGVIGYWSDWVGYGFPVPNNIRDLLVGDDKKYF